MNIVFTAYDPATGQVLYTGTADDPQVLASPGEAAILVGHALSNGWLADGIFHAQTAAPSLAHEFDWTTKQWLDPRTLSDLRATAHAKIERWRDEQESSGMFFGHAAREWDGGLVVRQRLQPVLSLPALPPGFFWTDAGNADVPMDMPALQALAAAHEQALVVRGFEIHARQRAMKNALDSMTRDELLAFTPDWDIP